jgi:hypothetical protein
VLRRELILLLHRQRLLRLELILLLLLLRRRIDAIGVPYGITVDFESLENGTFTFRERDTMGQRRLTENEITAFLAEHCP